MKFKMLAGKYILYINDDGFVTHIFECKDGKNYVCDIMQTRKNGTVCRNFEENPITLNNLRVCYHMGTIWFRRKRK